MRLYAGLGVIAACAAVAGLFVAEPLLELLLLLAYGPMLGVVALVWRLEHPSKLEQPNQASTVVRSDMR